MILLEMCIPADLKYQMKIYWNFAKMYALMISQSLSQPSANIIASELLMCSWSLNNVLG